MVKIIDGINEKMKEGKLFAYFSIYISGKSTYPEELEKPIRDGDELNILFIIGGG